MRRAPLPRLLAFACPLRAGLLVAALAGAATTAAGVALLGTSGYLIARAAEHPSVTALAVVVVTVRALGIGRGVLRYAERLKGHDVAFRVLGDVRVRLYERLAAIAPAGLRAFRSGDLLARLVTDVDAVQDLFVRGVLPYTAAVLAGAGTVTACAFLLAPAAGALAAGLLVAGAVVPVLTCVIVRRSAVRGAAARGTLTLRIADALVGARDLVAFGARDAAVGAVRAADAVAAAGERRAAVASALGAGLGTAVSGLTVWAVLLLGVGAVRDGTLDSVSLAVLVLTALAAFEVVAPLPAATARLAETAAGARRIAAVLDAPDPIRIPARPLPAPSRPVTVRMRGVGARYEPDGPWAVRGLDLEFVPGRRVALVGPSGSGKSTVAALLLRFLDADEGAITVNGHDIAAYEPDDVRRVIGGCPQDPHLFDSTIRENLRLARSGATDAELLDAADAARLLPWIAALPEGLDTPVGAHGTALSGGSGAGSRSHAPCWPTPP
ncbi:thiol reductant ABC exporter subunit CydC [Actinomadura rayongensis]|uniref:thiol reductant ABC exporter subunit CydC n=1 Tax=Actinomadura rayongensis TaxID=1429076 RepID=UPI00301DF18C